MTLIQILKHKHVYLFLKYKIGKYLKNTFSDNNYYTYSNLKSNLTFYTDLLGEV